MQRVGQVLANELKYFHEKEEQQQQQAGEGKKTSKKRKISELNVKPFLILISDLYADFAAFGFAFTKEEESVVTKFTPLFLDYNKNRFLYQRWKRAELIQRLQSKEEEKEWHC